MAKAKKELLDVEATEITEVNETAETDIKKETKKTSKKKSSEKNIEDVIEEATQPEVSEELTEDDVDEFIKDGASEILKERETTEKKKAAEENISTVNSLTGGDGITKAGKRAKRQMYKAEQILTEDGIDYLDEDVEETKMKWLDLVASFKSNKILSGEIMSCRVVGENPGMLVVDVMYGPFSVVIPATELIEVSESDLDTFEKVNYFKTRLNHRIGSKIDFIVVGGLDEKKKSAVGSRRSAMYLKQYAYYIRKNRNSDPLITIGKLVNANVVDVNDAFLTLEVFGVETTLKQEDVSYSRVEGMSSIYDVGETVPVRIKAIATEKVQRKVYAGGKERTVTISLVKIIASIKEVKEDPRKDNYVFFEVGGNYKGTVTQVTESGVFVSLCDKMDCLCLLPERENIPTRGSKVVVYVTRKVDEDYRIFGQIKKVIKLA